MRQHIFVAAFASILLYGPHSSQAESTTPEELCSSLDSIPLGETLSLLGAPPDSEPLRLRLDLETPGLLAAEVYSARMAQPWIDVRVLSCPEALSAPPPILLAQSLPRKILFAEAGSYLVEIGEVSPHPDGGPWTLTTRFIDAHHLRRSFPPAESPNLTPLYARDQNEGSSDPGTEESVNEVFPSQAPPLFDPDWQPSLFDLFLASPACYRLQRSGNDATVCAHPIAMPPEGGILLTVPSAESSTYYRFRLRRTRTVRLTTTSDADTFGSLYDQHGYRLASDDDSGEGENFAIEALLKAGEYWVRVGPARLP